MGDLNKNDRPIGSGAIIRCGLVGISVSLCEQALRLHVLKVGLVHRLLLLPADQDVELSTPFPAPCLPTSRHADDGLSL